MGSFLFRALVANGFAKLPERPATPAPRRRMLLERLEDRLLFDAGPVAPVDVDLEMAQAASTAQQSMQEAASISEPADIRVIAPLDNVAEVVADLTRHATNSDALMPNANRTSAATVDGAATAVLDSGAGAPLNSDEVARQLLTTSDEQRSELHAATADVRHELVFIDAGVMDAATLIAGIDPRAEVIQLDASRDGVDQILEVLSQRNDVSAIHLVAHGVSGQLQLGSAVLNLDTMSSLYADRLQQLGQYLTADADILVYGCDFAKGLVGLAAEEMLANLTGADVAGSVDATGNAAFGGNWNLERNVGLVQTDIVFGLAAQNSWQYLLAKLDWDTVSWTNGSLSQSYSVGGGTISLTLTGDTGRILSGPVDNTTNTGGLSPVEQSLLIDVDYQAQATIGDEAITATINFSHTGGVSNVSFTMFDIDFATFTDQIIVTGNNGATINPSSVTMTAGTEVVFDGINKVTGTASNNSTSSNGNATFTFNQTGITQITIIYQSGQLANPTQQFVSLHDINFNVTPTSSNNTVTTAEDAPLTFAAGNFPFSDVDAGDTLQSVKITSLPGVGSLTLSGVAVTVNQVIPVGSLGSLVFTPVLNGNGSPYTTFGFQVSDGTAFSSTATQTVNVTPVNDAPTTANNSVTTPEDTPFTFAAGNFPFSDVDAGNTLQSVRITSLPGVGSLTLSGVAVTVNQVIPVGSLGSLVFTPVLNGNGSPYTTFGFQVSDGTVFSGTATQTVNVTPVNDAPTTANNSVTTPEDTPFTFAAGNFPFSDVDAGNTLQSVRITSLPGVGSLALSGVAVTVNQVIPVGSLGSLVFTPVLSGNGSPYTTFGFQVSDGTAFSGTATQTVNVTPVNDAPTTANNSVTTPEDTPFTFAAGNFPFSDVDAGNTLQSVRITSLPGVGSLTLSGVAVTVNQVIPVASLGNLVFNPVLNGNGSPYTTFGFQVSDGTAFSGTATQTVNVTPVNDAPTTGNNSVTTAEDTPFTFASGLFPFSDVDVGDTLQSVRITSLPGVGSLTLSGVAVTANQVIPVASLGNLVFTPALNGTGSPHTTFGFQVSDGTAFSSTATLTVNVTPVNDAPTTANNSVTTPEDTPFTFAAGLFPFSDVDAGDTLQSVRITSLPGAGSLTLGGVAVTANQVIPVASLGTLIFTPALNGNGSPYTTFGFQVSDGTAFSSTATLTVNVTPVNDAPTTANNSVTTPEDTPFTFAAGNFPFSDIDTGDTLQSVRITSLPGVGSLTFSGVAVTVNQVIPVGSLGSLVFTPVLNGNGSPYTTFGFQVSDGTAFSSTATQTVNVTPVNDAPTTANNSVTTLENVPVAFASSSFPFSDVDVGNTLQSVMITSLPSVGTLTLGGVAVTANQVIPVASLGSLVFTPVLNQNGSPYTTFNFQVSDGTAFSNTGTMTVNVVAVPDLSVTVSDGGVTANANDTVVYSLSYANSGKQDATGVYLLETVPTGSAFNAGASSPSWFNIGGNNYRLDIGSVAMGASGTALFAVTVNSSIAAGQTQLVNSVSIADDGTHGVDLNLANNSGSDTTPLDVAPDLRLTKSDGTSSVSPSASVVYSLSYSNGGTQDATGVLLTETLPAGATFDVASSTLGWNFVSGSTYQFNLGNVAVGESGTVLFAVTVNSPVTAGQNSFVNSATITDDGGNGPDLNPADNSPTDTDTLNAQPDYQLTLSDAVASVAPGQSVNYTVAITNDGNQNGTGVVVSGQFPNAILHNVAVSGGGVVDQTSGTITWSVGSLAVGALQTFTITADVWPSIPAGYDNFVVSGSITDDLTNGSDPTPANNFASDTDALDAAPDLRVSKSDFTNTASPGQCLVYTVSVANVGNQDATNVVVTETVPVGTTFNSVLSDPLWVLVAPNTYQVTIASLAAGAGFNINFDVNVTSPANPAQANIVNTVTIADDGTNGSDPNPGDNTGSDTNALVAVPDYQITITDGEVVVAPGQSLSYSVSFTNAGDRNGTGIIVTDSFPIAVLENVVASDGGIVDAVAGTITWNVGNFAVGQVCDFTVTAKVRDAVPAGIDNFSHSTSITDDLSNGADPTPGNNASSDTDTLNAVPDYRIAITDGQTAVAPGQVLSYSVSFLNAGNQNGTGVVISDTFPIAILENVIASDGGVVDAVAGTITWNVGTLASGESRNFTVTAKVRDTIPAGFDDFAHSTTISDDGTNGTDPAPADNFSSDTDTLNASPDYQVSINDGVLTATAGQSLTYSVTFANTGLQDGTGVVVSNAFPLSVLTNVVASSGGIVDMTTGTITWNVGNFAAGVSLSYTVTADVLASVAAGLNDFTHSTTITDDGTNGTDPTPENNSASDTDTLNAAPDLRLTKTDFTNSISPGQSGVYTLNVSNAGTQGATNVVVSETVPIGATFNAAFSDPAWTNVGGNVYQYSILSLPAGAGFNVNFAVTIDTPAVSGQTNLVNTATITDDGTNGVDLDPTSNTATDSNTLDATPNYDIGIDDLKSTVLPGQTLTYFVNFNNYGLQNGTGVIVSATFPTAILTNVVASNGGVVDAIAGTITWNVGALTANDPHTFTVTAGVRPTLAAGLDVATLTASITDDGTNGLDPNLSDNTAADTDTLNAQPDYAITIDDGKTQVTVGDPLTYTINVHNNGKQDGTGVTVTVTFPTLALENVTASGGGVIDAVAGTITWNLGDLPAGGSQTLTVNTQVRGNVTSQTPPITVTATVTDDGANGPDPTPLNNSDRDVDVTQLYAYDTFHDWKEMRFGFFAPQQQTVGRPLAPLPVDPVFSGLTEPGSTLVARIYDADGRLLGDRQVVADTGGNWLVSFPNIIIYEQPHRMEIIVTPAVNNLAHENGFNLRRYFHPAIHAGLVMTESLSVAGVFRNRAYNIVEAQHSANTHPLGFQWYSHAYELNTASSNVSQM